MTISRQRMLARVHLTEIKLANWASMLARKISSLGERVQAQGWVSRLPREFKLVACGNRESRARDDAVTGWITHRQELKLATPGKDGVTHCGSS